MMRVFENPSARAASTYGISRIASALDRTIRAASGMKGMQIATITWRISDPKTATTVSAMIIVGKAISTSITRWMNRSTLPPRKALVTPRMRPVVAPVKAAMKPMNSAVRAP
jgi:hypothetical protein